MSLIELAPRIWAATLFTNEEAEIAYQALLAVTKWTAATVTAPSGETIVREDVRRCMAVPLTEVPVVDELLATRIENIAADAAHIAGEIELKTSETSIIKYEPGGFFRSHTDSGPRDSRLFSIIAYLNDNFTGGGTIFPTRGITITPQAGLAILFLSAELHGGESLISGIKFIATTWLDRSSGIRDENH